MGNEIFHSQVMFNLRRSHVCISRQGPHMVKKYLPQCIFYVILESTYGTFFYYFFFTLKNQCFLRIRVLLLGRFLKGLSDSNLPDFLLSCLKCTWVPPGIFVLFSFTRPRTTTLLSLEVRAPKGSKCCTTNEQFRDRHQS